MRLQLHAARAVSTLSTWALKHIFKRPAANFPGKIALYLDPSLIADLAPKLSQGSLVICGTNGKTTVTNLVADALEASGASVICNRTGANLDSGIASALLNDDPANWGVFECDELWLAKVLPHLKPNYLILLNLFRDQLDRVGEIDTVQASIAGALASSPQTVLVYHADDPLCASIAARVPNKNLAMGINEAMGAAQNTVVDAQMCQNCSGMLVYEYRQYGQLGSYHCEKCGFTRPNLEFVAQNVSFGAQGLTFDLQDNSLPSNTSSTQITAPFSGAYMVYNLLASAVATHLTGGDSASFQQALNAFNPKNGRLQNFIISGHHVLLNLAKNPTGFNQNLSIITAEENVQQQIITFSVNDREGDGRDLSWLWDVDFEELAALEDAHFFVTGIRKNELQVRLKYAGLSAVLVENAQQVFTLTKELSSGAHYYFIANYTALPSLREELTSLEKTGDQAHIHSSKEGE